MFFLLPFSDYKTPFVSAFSVFLLFTDLNNNRVLLFCLLFSGFWVHLFIFVSAYCVGLFISFCLGVLVVLLHLFCPPLILDSGTLFLPVNLLLTDSMARIGF